MGLAAGAGEAPDTTRAALLAAPITAKLGGDTTRVISADDAYTFLADNAPADRQRPFAFGNRLFNTQWAEYPGSVQSFDGLGPTFNRTSCSGCHVRDGRGQPPAKSGDPLESMLIRLSAADGSPHPDYGDQLEDRAMRGVPPEGHSVIRYDDGSRHLRRRDDVHVAQAARRIPTISPSARLTGRW